MCTLHVHQLSVLFFFPLFAHAFRRYIFRSADSAKQINVYAVARVDRTLHDAHIPDSRFGPNLAVRAQKPFSAGVAHAVLVILGNC